jgi:hypothetical protein
MFRLNGNQVRRLRMAIQAVYQGPNPQLLFWQFLFERLDVQLSDLTSAATFPLQISEALVKLSALERTLELLAALEQEYSHAAPLLVVIGQLRAEAGPTLADAGAEARLRALKDEYLLLDGLPFINRTRLRQILVALLDTANPARVGVVAGAALSGKSWSLHLVRAYCKAMQQPKVRRIFLDLERLQPGNDPLVVWTALMTQLSSPRAPPPPPPADTKGGQYVQRLVDEVSKAWEAWEAPGLEEKPWLLVVFDHLEKNASPAVGPAVVDFAEALAMAAVEGRLEGGRVLLLGFPRGFSPTSQTLSVGLLAPREEVSPLTLGEVKDYLADVGAAIGRGAPPDIEAAAEAGLREADAKTIPEERRVALTALSATIGHHVSVLARAP